MDTGLIGSRNRTLELNFSLNKQFDFLNLKNLKTNSNKNENLILIKLCKLSFKHFL